MGHKKVDFIILNFIYVDWRKKYKTFFDCSSQDKKTILQACKINSKFVFNVFCKNCRLCAKYRIMFHILCWRRSSHFVLNESKRNSQFCWRNFFQFFDESLRSKFCRKNGVNIANCCVNVKVMKKNSIKSDIVTRCRYLTLIWKYSFLLWILLERIYICNM